MAARQPASIPRTGQWNVTVDLRGDGQATWNTLAQQCFSGAATCPSRQLAIVLDDVIQTAPTVNEPNFPGNVQISGAFSEDEVRDLARVINRGAFPVTVVQQRVETVSPTAGENSFRSAVIAGVIGVVLMLLYMVFYYRKLSVVIILQPGALGSDRLHHGVVRVEHVELRVHDRRCDRHHHQRRRHGRHLRGVLRANP